MSDIYVDEDGDKFHICPELKRQARTLSDSDYFSTFRIQKIERRWLASVDENDYTSQPIRYCPYCGEKLP